MFVTCLAFLRPLNELTSRLEAAGSPRERQETGLSYSTAAEEAGRSCDLTGRSQVRSVSQDLLAARSQTGLKKKKKVHHHVFTAS